MLRFTVKQMVGMTIHASDEMRADSLQKEMLWKVFFGSLETISSRRAEKLFNWELNY